MNLAVIAGVAVTTAVLTGALMVGDSLRGSLRDLTLDRLGRTDQALLNNRFFPSELASRLSRQPEMGSNHLDLVPAVYLHGSAVHPSSERRASGVQIIGIESGFPSLFPASQRPEDLVLARGPNQIFPSVVLNEALRQELDAAVGEDVLVSFGQPSAVPTASLMGRREQRDILTTSRLTVTGVIPASGPGRFGLEARQTRPLNAFIDLSTLQSRLDKPQQINLLLVGRPAEQLDDNSGSPDLEAALSNSMELADLGLRIRRGPGYLAVESDELLIRPATAEIVLQVAEDLGATAWPYLTYLANRMEVGDRLLPYSTVTALATPIPDSLGDLVVRSGATIDKLAAGQIALSSWAAEDLAAQVGDVLELSYYLVGSNDELLSASSTFRVSAIVEMQSLAVDPTLTPDVPGVSDADDMTAWDPPFPVDLDLVRPRDEAYWDEFRGTPKAFMTLEQGQELWQSRYGQLTSIRLVPAPGSDLNQLQADLETRLPQNLSPELAGFRFLPVRARGLEGASGTTDFAGLFLGFSLFLIVSAALLVALLFALLVESRAHEAGLLLATGYSVGAVRRRFVLEGGTLGVLGTLLGTGLAVVYTRAVLKGLAAWWSPVLDSPVLGVHIVPRTLIVGGVSALILVVMVIVWTVRRVSRIPARQLLAGQMTIPTAAKSGRRAARTAIFSFLLAVIFFGISLLSGMESAPALFFGVGGALLVSGIAAYAAWAGKTQHRQTLNPRLVISTLATRNSSRNLGRSLLSITLVASASFVLVSVSASRKTHSEGKMSLTSGTGGLSVVAEADTPLPAEMGQVLESSPATFFSFRLLPGDDASCLNLYQPDKPRVLGVPAAFVERGGFRFHSVLSPTDNPWTRLNESLPDGAIPAIGDFNSVRWILHSGLGQDLVLETGAGEPVRLRIVGLLDTSIFQSELLISEEMFLRHFPDHDGYAFFLGDLEAAALDSEIETMESQLSAYGVDAESAVSRLTDFQAVENMYLTTFEVLGGLGLLLGTVGLGVVLLRNTLERRGELAVLRSFGYQRSTLAWIVVAENAFLLMVGLTVGSTAGLIAVAPHLLTGGIQVPWISLAAILLAVFAVGLFSSVAAVIGSLRVPLLPALKAD